VRPTPRCGDALVWQLQPACGSLASQRADFVANHRQREPWDRWMGRMSMKLKRMRRVSPLSRSDSRRTTSVWAHCCRGPAHFPTSQVYCSPISARIAPSHFPGRQQNHSKTVFHERKPPPSRVSGVKAVVGSPHAPCRFELVADKADRVPSTTARNPSDAV
jgi:hypothetical protein